MLYQMDQMQLLTKQMLDRMQAMTALHRSTMDVLIEYSETCFDYYDKAQSMSVVFMQTSFDHAMGCGNGLLQARTMRDSMDIINGFSKKQIDNTLKEATRASELASLTLQQAIAPLHQRFSAALVRSELPDTVPEKKRSAA